MREGRSHAASAPISAEVLRAVARRWPVVVLITLGAVLAGCLALAMRDDSYQATANLLVVPLAQSDETFLGTSLIRDSGDASRTPATVAKALHARDIGGRPRGNSARDGPRTRSSAPSPSAPTPRRTCST